MLKNPKRADLPPVEIEGLVDTASVYLVIPEVVRAQLELDTESTRRVTLADGSQQSVPYVGPVETRFKNRVAFVGAVVMGKEVLLGAIPMEDMDLILRPKGRLADINPEHPQFAHGLVK